MLKSIRKRGLEIILKVLFIGTIFTGCEKDDLDLNTFGKWVNIKDTLYFYGEERKVNNFFYMRTIDSTYLLSFEDFNNNKYLDIPGEIIKVRDYKKGEFLDILYDSPEAPVYDAFVHEKIYYQADVRREREAEEVRKRFTIQSDSASIPQNF